MLARDPLMSIRNESFIREKVQRTYGKKAKASATMASAKEIFTATHGLERSLQLLTISHAKESIAQSGNKESAKQEEDATSGKVRTKKSYVQQPTKCPRTTATLTDACASTRSSSTDRVRRSKPKNESDSSSSTSEPQLLSPEISKNDRAIEKFASKYSDRKVLAFEKYGKIVAKKYDVKKIGEGAYSSVFALNDRYISTDGASTPSSQSQCSNSTSQNHSEDVSYGTTILKMMPIAPPSQPDLEGQTIPYHIANELQTMNLMDSLHGFIRYRSLTVVKGTWPANFLDAFRQFKKTCRKKAENEDPETAYGANQYYALIEMEDAGAELSDVVKRPSDFQIYDVFWQTCIHLAAAESEREFEHRDLHVSNICVKPDIASDGESVGRIDITESMASTMTERPDMLLGMSNISVTLIDYTFSRLILPPDSGYDEHGTKQTNFREFTVAGDDYDTLLAKSLSSKEQKRIGNSGEKFEDRMQQLTYAKVAKIVDSAHERAERHGEISDAAAKRHIAPWQRCVPRSNVCWLGYLLTCLLARAGKTAKTKYVAGSNDMAKQVQDELRQKMIRLKDLLLEEDIEQMPSSAEDVVKIGIDKGWLSRKEIDKFKERLEEDS